MPRIDNNYFYSKSIAKFGISAKGVHWNNKDSQYTRFKIITQLIPEKINNITICDIGCGFGEYYIYLTKNNQLPLDYLGVDIEPKMVEIAKKRINTNFECKDVLKDKLKSMDYFVCSGALNILTKEESLIFIKNAYNASKKGLIFNFLDSSKISNQNIYNGFAIDEIIQLCSIITKNISYKSGYLNGDFTVYLKKE